MAMMLNLSGWDLKTFTSVLTRGKQRGLERRRRRQWDEGSRCGKDDVMMHSYDPEGGQSPEREKAMRTILPRTSRGSTSLATP